MVTEQKSSDFTQPGDDRPLGPPLIGALLRIPWEQVLRRMLERLHEHGFADLDAAHLNLLLYPGPQGARPSELAARRGMSKQAVNYLLGELERLGYLERRVDPTTGAPSASCSPAAASKPDTRSATRWVRSSASGSSSSGRSGSPSSGSCLRELSEPA